MDMVDVLLPIWAPGPPADHGQNLALKVGFLGNGLLDELCPGGRLLYAGRHLQVRLERLGGARWEKTLGHELAGLGDHSLVAAGGHGRRDVRQGHPGPSQRQDLGDPATHVARAHHREPTRHALLLT